MCQLLLTCMCICFFVQQLAGCSTSSTKEAVRSHSVAKTIALESKLLVKEIDSGTSSTAQSPSHFDSADSVTFSYGGHGVAYIKQSENTSSIIHNGVQGKKYQSVDNITLSLDGRHIAYSARQNDSFNRVVYDGSEGPLFDDIGLLKFSFDGLHLAYVGTHVDKHYLVIDNKEHLEYQLAAVQPVFNYQSNKIAFTAKKPADDKMQFIISDLKLKEKIAFEGCGENFVENSDTSRLAVVCSDDDSKSVRVIDFLTKKIVSSTPFNGRITRLKFASNGKSIVFTTQEKDVDRKIIYNSKEFMIPKGDEFFSDPEVMSNIDSVIAIIGTAYKSRLYSVSQNGSRSDREYGYIENLVSSKDGKHYVYIATNVNDTKQHIVVDGKEGPLFDKIVDPVFNPAGNLLVYRVRLDGKRFLIVSDFNGKIISQHKDYDMVYHADISTDGKFVGYGVRVGKELWWKVEKL